MPIECHRQGMDNQDPASDPEIHRGEKKPRLRRPPALRAGPTRQQWVALLVGHIVGCRPPARRRGGLRWGRGGRQPQAFSRKRPPKPCFVCGSGSPLSPAAAHIWRLCAALAALAALARGRGGFVAALYKTSAFCIMRYIN